MTARLLALGLAVTAGLACGEKKVAGPTGGDLTVAFSTTVGNNGALLILVNGAVDAVRPLGGYQVSSAPVGLSSTRVVVTGSIAPGDLFTITVKDVSLTYTAQVEAAADRATFALNDPGQYTATVRR
jgi:hypothetical protein